MPYGFVELHGGSTRVRIVPALGGKISSLEAGGRQWLWVNEGAAEREPRDGAAYDDTVDTGGYDECFPTVAACNLPGGVQRFGGLALPDHGELWGQRADVAVATDPAGQRATCTWHGRRLPYVFSRVVQVTSAGAVIMRYGVRNTGPDPLPFVWSAHPLLPLTESTRLDLPIGARVRVWAHHGDALRGLSSEFRWPHARLERRIADLSMPDQLGRHFACKMYLDVPPGSGAIAIEEGGARLEVAFDESAVPNLGLWLNKREWSPFRRGKRYANVGFEPCIGAPDSLADALGPWQGAHWLSPGGTRDWVLTWQAIVPRGQVNGGQ